MPTSKTRKKNIGSFEWDMLVGAWRYYENRSTITGSMFPGDIVKRYFGGDYEDDECRRIAYQFAEDDHGISGALDWCQDKDATVIKWKLDYCPWLKFYEFCHGWCKGFENVQCLVVKDGHQVKETVRAFYLEATGRWYPVDEYLKYPYNEIYIPKETLVNP